MKLISPKKQILFVMPSLGGAGAERVVSTLLNNLDRNLFILQLIVLKEKGSNTFIKDLKPDVKIVSLGLRHRLRFSLISFLYKLIKQIRQDSPDILFMGAGTINAFFSPFLFLLPKNTKRIARESNLPSRFEKINFILWLYKKFYNKYDAIIAQSDDMVAELVNNFKIKSEKIIKINNPVDVYYVNQKLNEKKSLKFPQEKINLLAAGRLTYQKGFDLLIMEFAQLKNKNIHLTILGEGEEKENLESLAKSLGVENKITFLGNIENPFLYMAKANVFILSSRFEGFPNVLLESLVCGCPVLANNCLGGISEIIKEGFNGYIFEFQKQNFTSHLEMTLNTKFDKKLIVEDIIGRFSVEEIISNYNNIFID